MHEYVNKNNYDYTKPLLLNKKYLQSLKNILRLSISIHDLNSNKKEIYESDSKLNNNSKSSKIWHLLKNKNKSKALINVYHQTFFTDNEYNILASPIYQGMNTPYVSSIPSPLEGHPSMSSCSTPTFPGLHIQPSSLHDNDPLRSHPGLFKVCLCNARGVGSKTDTINDYKLDKDLDLFLIVESFLTDSDNKIIGDLKENGQGLLQVPRKNRQGGGIVCLYKNELNV